MKRLIVVMIVSFLGAGLYGQQDTVFITSNSDWTGDTLNYKTDTVIFPSAVIRNMLIGTTVLATTYGQQVAKGSGIWFTKVTKSECRNGGEELAWEADRIASIVNTDTSLVVTISIVENCCYDFLCDISVDSTETLNLIFQGYGAYCACNCGFLLTYEFIKTQSPVQAVMIGGDRKTIKPIK